MPMSLDYKYVPLTNALCRYIRNTRTRTPIDDVLEEVRVETRKLGRLAVMQVPEEQGEFLHLLVSILGVSNAFEAGTFTGYSSICIASGLSAGGRLITCDTNARYGEIAQRYWEKLSMGDRLKFVNQDALKFLRSLPEKRKFDFAFIDADRLHYVEYFKELVGRVRANGVIIFDNMLAKGKIAEGTGRTVITRRRLNEYAAKDSRVEALILPIGDGMLMCRVKG